MKTSRSKATISITLTDLENLIRRVVREELVRARAPSIADDWTHEGPEDLAGDQVLLAEALASLETFQNTRQDWKSLEEFETELAENEVKGELPR